MSAMQEQHSSEGLAKTIGRNTFAGVISNVVQIGTRLVTVPVVIHHLGLDGYGIWNIIMMTAGYMRFGSVGVKTAFQKYVAEATGNGDYERANILLSTGSAFMLVLSLAALIPAAFFSRAIARMSSVPSNFLGPAAASIALLAVIMLMSNTGAGFEATLLGGQRIDLHRKFGTVMSIAEAGFILLFLHFGYGLTAMAAVMGASELVFLIGCWIMGRRAVPQIRMSVGSVRLAAVPELIRFAGSYQLINLLDVVASLIIPVAILRNFGANLAGVYAVVSRIAGTAASLQYQFLVPLLSAGAMVFASGSAEKMRALLTKAFKVTLGLSLFPLGFLVTLGPTLAYAWTGQTSPKFGTTFLLISLSSLFASFSLLALVLYRATGRVKLDNLRQLLRVPILAAVLGLAPHLGFSGVLSGMVLCELFGMLMLFYALWKTFDSFRIPVVLPGMLRLSLAGGLILAAGVAASHIPIPGYQPSRFFAMLKLIEAGLASMIVAWPLLVRTGSLTTAEKKALLASMSLGARRSESNILVG